MKYRIFSPIDGSHWYDFIVLEESKNKIKYELRYSNSDSWRTNLRGKLILEAVESEEDLETIIKFGKLPIKLRADQFSEMKIFLNAINHYSKFDDDYEMLEEKGIRV